MIDVLNLALPYFSLIFIGFACGKARGLPEAGLAWMNFFLLYVSLPALLYGIMSKTPFSELNNPPFLIATTCGTMAAFADVRFAQKQSFNSGQPNGCFAPIADIRGHYTFPRPLTLLARAAS